MLINPRVTEYVLVFCPSGQLKLFKFDPIEFSPLRCIQATNNRRQRFAYADL